MSSFVEFRCLIHQKDHPSWHSLEHFGYQIHYNFFWFVYTTELRSFPTLGELMRTSTFYIMDIYLCFLYWACINRLAQTLYAFRFAYVMKLEKDRRRTGKLNETSGLLLRSSSPSFSMFFPLFRSSPFLLLSVSFSPLPFSLLIF